MGKIAQPYRLQWPPSAEQWDYIDEMFAKLFKQTGVATATSDLDNPVPVGQGGTGLTVLTPYALVAGGLTAAAPVQQVSGLGTAPQILTSQGPGALPAWVTPSYISSPEVPIVATVSQTVDTNFGEVIPEALEVAAGIIYEIAGGARVEITGSPQTVTATSSSGFTNVTFPGTCPRPGLVHLAWSQVSNLTAVTFLASEFGWGHTLGAGTATNVNDPIGTWSRLTSGAVAGNTAQSTWESSTGWARREWFPFLELRWRMGAVITGTRQYFGLFNTQPSGVSDNNASVIGWGFRYSTVAPDTGWRAWTADGTTQVLGSTMLPAIANNIYVMTCYADATGAITFSIQNLTAGTSAAGTLATPNTGITVMRPQLSVFTTDANAKAFDVKSLYGQHN